MVNNWKILLFLSFFGMSICDLYFTTITSGEVYFFNFTTNTGKVVAKNQGALSKITNGRYNLFWISGKNIMRNTKGYWNDVFLFSKIDITFDKHISAMHVNKNTLYWSIGNKIYSQDVFGTTASIYYTSPDTNTVITSIVVIYDFEILLFANTSNSLFLIDTGTKKIQAIDYTDTLTQDDCGLIYDIRTLGGTFVMITNGQSTDNSGGYGCIFKGSVQDIRNLKIYQKSGVSKFDLLDIAINTTSILSLHPNTNCLTSIFMDYPKFCVPDSLGYFGGVSFDIVV